jgi:hypothetical protein
LALTRFSERLDPLNLLDRKLCGMRARLRPFWRWLVLGLDLGTYLEVSIRDFAAAVGLGGR